ncbi:MAG TPA: hypothetical protein PKA90_15630 [Ignavibacteria bacterium]|nr:hypothetical protein [Ignavibacteria bacterium]HMR41849.1 hypothetical protein [Ignavibacteria bacterium]
MNIRRIIKFSLAILIISQNLFSQSLLKEDFNYSVLDSLENSGGWIREGLNSIYNVKVVSPGLSYAGYIGSGIGNSAFFSNINEGDNLSHYFTLQNSGSLYASCLIRVDSFTATATSGFNIAFNQGTGGTYTNTTLNIKRLSATTFNFGIGKTSSPSYSSNTYNTNTTYLAVIKYTFVNGDNNDSVKMYIFNAGVPATEPSVPTAYNISGVDIANIGSVVLTNGYAQGNGLKSSSAKVDGIRVGTTWTNTVLQQINVQLNLKVLLQGFYNNSLNTMVRDTARVYLRSKNAPYQIADSSKAFLDANGNGSYVFTRVSNFEGYYLDVRHRNSIETWSYIPRQFSNNLLSFDFTQSAGSAYGGNQIQSGFKYCIYGGDDNRDGTVDLTDVVLVSNAATTFTNGYVQSDMNGDNITDLTDLVMTSNNAGEFVHKIKP